MKKVVAILVAAILMLSGISAFAAGTPAEEGAVYRAAINAGMSRPDYIVRHFDSIAALTTAELAAVDSYFAAIDDAVKVAVANVEENLSRAQLVTIFSNLNAIAKIAQVSYTVSAAGDVVYGDDAELAFTLLTSKVFEPTRRYEVGQVWDLFEGDFSYEGTYSTDETEYKVYTVDWLINNSLVKNVKSDLDDAFDDAVDAIAELATLTATFDGIKHYGYEIKAKDFFDYIGRDEMGRRGYRLISTGTEIEVDGITYVAGDAVFAVCWLSKADIASYTKKVAYAGADYGLTINFYCEEDGVCIGNKGSLSAISTNFGIFDVTGSDSMYAANSGLRTLFSNLQKVIKAVADYKPAAAAATTTDSTGDRLPDTATSYGNMIVLGIVMMIVAAAAVVGIKKVAFNS